MRRLGPLAAAVACAALLGACGGGDGDGPDTPKPAESIKQFEARLKTVVAAIQQGQCDAVDQFNEKSGMPLACGADAKKLFAGFQVVGSKAYGTGGVVEFKAAQVQQGVGVYTIAIGDDGKYAITGPVAPVIPASSLAAEPKDPGAMDDAAGEMIAAIRANDCDRFLAAVVTPEGLEKDKACKQELEELYEPLRQQLTSHKNAKPERLDGNDRFMFYALRTGREYRTLIVGRTGPEAAKPFIGFVTFRGPGDEPNS